MPGFESEAPDLRLRDIHVIAAGQVVVLGKAKKAKAILHYFQASGYKGKAFLSRLELQQLKDQIVAFHLSVTGDCIFLSQFLQLIL